MVMAIFSNLFRRYFHRIRSPRPEIKNQGASISLQKAGQYHLASRLMSLLLRWIHHCRGSADRAPTPYETTGSCGVSVGEFPDLAEDFPHTLQVPAICVGGVCMCLCACVCLCISLSLSVCVLHLWGLGLCSMSATFLAAGTASGERYFQKSMKQCHRNINGFSPILTRSERSSLLLPLPCL